MSDTKADAGGEEKSVEKTAEPVYPEMPPHQVRPDKERYQQTLAVLDEEIKTLTEKRTKMQAGVRDAEAGGGDVREARGSETESHAERA